MGTEAALVAAGAFVTCAILTGLMRRLAVSHGVLDVPNERSAHVTPTPRGGGVAIVIAASAAFALLAWRAVVPVDLMLALLGGGVAVALVGFFDDRLQLAPAVRIVVHLAAALWALACLGGLPPLRIAGHLVEFGWFGYALGAIGIVWTLNLFNFMDGIDGIAASEAVFISWSGAALALVSGIAAVPAAGFTFGAACCGFLWWNWPPAKIFMGDVGSGYLGFVIAVLAVAAARANAIALFVWLVLGGVFFVDATVTFVRRLVRGERVYQAHRSHAYQWLARRWGSHRRVTIATLAVNLLWLLPLAWLAATQPNRAAIWSAIALAPLVVVALFAGSGRRESRTP